MLRRPRNTHAHPWKISARLAGFPCLTRPATRRQNNYRLRGRPAMLKAVTVRDALIAFAATLSLSAHALADAPKKVDVPAGDLTAALETLAKQSGVEFVYSAEQLKGIHTKGVHGEFTPEKAVIKLLEGTKLKLTTHGSGALLISENNGPGTSSSLQGTAGSEVS